MSTKPSLQSVMDAHAEFTVAEKNWKGWLLPAVKHLLTLTRNTIWGIDPDDYITGCDLDPLTGLLTVESENRHDGDNNSDVVFPITWLLMSDDEVLPVIYAKIAADAEAKQQALRAQVTQLAEMARVQRLADFERLKAEFGE